MILKSATVFLCIIISLTVCQYSENQYSEFIYTPKNVTYYTEKADDSIVTDDTRIAGGDYAQLGYFPYMAVVHRLLGYGMIGQCGGTIVSKRWVLTAGHCAIHYPRRFFVVFGIIDKSDIDYNFLQGPGVSMIATQVFIHPYYKQNENDIALLYMPQNIPFSNTIQPIELAYRDENFARQIAYVIGWGKDNMTSKGTMKLKYTTLPIISDLECKQFWHISDKHICTAPGLGRDACQGDSGGPLVVEKNGRDLQIGIVSYGDAFCPSNLPGVFTRVSSFIYWIHEVMKLDAESYIL